MKISRCINVKGEKTSKIQCLVGDSELFVEVYNEYSEYLVHEVDDPFIITSMLPSLMKEEDIECDTISDDLYYHSSTILFLLSKVFHKRNISIKAKNIVHVDFTPRAVASGFSGGIDSFCTYLKHTDSDCPNAYRMTHLTLFNSGAYGNIYERTHEKFEVDCARAEKFAAEVDMPFVTVNTNISTIFTHKDISNYSLRSIMCLSVCVLSLSKLFKIYYISGGYTIDKMRLTRYDQSYYGDSLVQLLSTHNTQIFMGETDMNRVEKTRLIMDNKLAQKYLYVCASDIFNERFDKNFQKDTAPNCSQCLKCTRTLITLELLDKLGDFSGRFDIEKYKGCKNAVIQDVMNKRSYDHFAQGIYELMLEKGWEIPFWRKFYGTIWGTWRQLRYRFYAK